MSEPQTTFELGNFLLKSGGVLPDCRLVYKTHGTLSSSKDNAVLVPSYFGGSHESYEPLIGEGMGLDPSRYFIICTNMFGNGMSSSPSNTPEPFNGPSFPRIDYEDNVRAQRSLVAEEFGVEKLALVAGFSMGAQQAFQWGAMFPDMVERMLPWCGSAKTRPHNWVFLDSVRTAIQTDPAFKDGEYAEPPLAGLRAAGRVWSAWGLSQEWWRRELFREAGSSTAQEFVEVAFATPWSGADANDRMSMIATWQDGDISNNPAHRGDFDSALASITAKAIIMPCRTDLYFPPEDNDYEAARMPNAEFRPIPSVYGHFAGRPAGNAEDTAFINDALRELLAR